VAVKKFNQNTVKLNSMFTNVAVICENTSFLLPWNIAKWIKHEVWCKIV